MRALFYFPLFVFVLFSCSNNTTVSPQKPCVEEVKEPCAATREYKPVCGCNGKTYDNPSVAACNGITEYTKGPCGSDSYTIKQVDSLEVKPCVEVVDSTCVTTLQYDPVCGCNGKTYSNSSEANCHGITEYTKGPCPEK